MKQPAAHGFFEVNWGEETGRPCIRIRLSEPSVIQWVISVRAFCVYNDNPVINQWLKFILKIAINSVLENRKTKTFFLPLANKMSRIALNLIFSDLSEYLFQGVSRVLSPFAHFLLWYSEVCVTELCFLKTPLRGSTALFKRSEVSLEADWPVKKHLFQPTESYVRINPASFDLIIAVHFIASNVWEIL